jgi:hypothetical protein
MSRGLEQPCFVEGGLEQPCFVEAYSARLLDSMTHVTEDLRGVIAASMHGYIAA